ncbi:MAG: DNA polymerase III subunit delta [Planctomycetaceae bacterium]|nr:DNA polymerase III subunit delta [Planctomycetaceae bacterium]
MIDIIRQYRELTLVDFIALHRRNDSHPSAVIMHATEFINSKKAFEHVPVVVLFGSERFLKLEALRRIPGCGGDGSDDELSLTKLNGSDVEFRDVVTELKTVSMFGDQRIVLIEDADEFVSNHRAALEKYVAHPSRSSLLILDVKSWQKTTKLYKAVAAVGLALECGQLKGAALISWLQRLAKDEHGKVLEKDAASLMIQLAGDSMGLLQQEVAKVAALVGETEQMNTDDVSRVVGGWRLETTWVMLDAVRDNNMSRAIEALEKLLQAGDAPQKILGGTTFTFRKLGQATELARTGTALPDALRSSGVMPFAVGDFERYMRRVGFEKASRILQWLCEADHDMKGGSRVDPKILLERLFVRLSGN